MCFLKIILIMSLITQYRNTVCIKHKLERRPNDQLKTNAVYNYTTSKTKPAHPRMMHRNRFFFFRIRLLHPYLRMVILLIQDCGRLNIKFKAFNDHPFQVFNRPLFSRLQFIGMMKCASFGNVIL